MNTTIQVGAVRVWPSGKEIEVIEQVTEGQYAGEYRYRYLEQPMEGIHAAGFLLQNTSPAPTDPSTGAVTAPTPSPVGAPSLVELDRREAAAEMQSARDHLVARALKWEAARSMSVAVFSAAADELADAVKAYLAAVAR